MKVCHVTVSVSDMKQSLLFYHEILELPIMQRFSPKDGVEIVFLGEGDAKIELIWVKEHKNISLGQDISIGLRVESAEQKREELLDKKVEVGSILSPNPHTRFFYVHDPDGLKIQLFERE